MSRCPMCASDTRLNRSVEHCTNCQATITRNERGEADEARNTRGQLVYRRRKQSAMPDDGTRTARPTSRDGNYGDVVSTFGTSVSYLFEKPT